MCFAKCGQQCPGYVAHSQALVVIHNLFCIAELDLLDGSKVVISSTKTSIKFKGKIIKWPYCIQCGLCEVQRQLDMDRMVTGMISKFKAGTVIYSICG